jgi:hypothetical protein
VGEAATQVPLIHKGGGWAPGPVRKNLAPNGIRSPGRPVHSESLCRPRYSSLHAVLCIYEPNMSHSELFIGHSTSVDK